MQISNRKAAGSNLTSQEARDKSCLINDGFAKPRDVEQGKDGETNDTMAKTTWFQKLVLRYGRATVASMCLVQVAQERKAGEFKARACTVVVVTMFKRWLFFHTRLEKIRCPGVIGLV